MNASDYLARIRAARPSGPDVHSLHALHRAHLLSVPFENLDIERGRPIRLEREALFRKVVGERRGGFCYELNGLFAWLLETLGFQVTLLSGRVFSSVTGERGPEFDHLALRVDLEEESWLCDVGFGEGFLHPLRLAEGAERAEGGWLHRVARWGDGEWLYERRRGDGAWERQYSFTLLPRRMEEFEAMCRFHQTSPASPFTRKRLCTVATEAGRATFTPGKLVVTRGGEREVTTLDGPEAEAAVLAERFGVVLPA
jgi:N-hydroxyarylamine O-acetyltransferase